MYGSKTPKRLKTMRQFRNLLNRISLKVLRNSSDCRISGQERLDSDLTVQASFTLSIKIMASSSRVIPSSKRQMGHLLLRKTYSRATWSFSAIMVEKEK